MGLNSHSTPPHQSELNSPGLHYKEILNRNLSETW
ncbi:hypothetical protein SPLC1_S051860 [Arthrospira platensis C1]|nr:hypothetical protein SPLC1_S051720 [Arthrospira platensis C1]EKD10968.1 hypothetical protein SPLC1_S051760 [Arthrospira platensis C1]EKD10971.1 hypothetical protein SPLC1_S051790 [Arthrospira platensis C1]EKD10974.1 hypothetical protein SPLC1_S051820 [Arthrospira platensis C1]EKD10978.1 hypothetical protein SPLC1_S051860 [Arthrospira platensis C1]